MDTMTNTQRSLSHLRPRGDGSAAYDQALQEIAAERIRAVQRVETARQNRKQAADDPTVSSADVVELEHQARAAEVEIERLDALTADFTMKSAQAFYAEAEARLEAAEARHALVAAEAAFAEILPTYGEATAPLMSIVETMRARDAAEERYRLAAARCGGSFRPIEGAVDARWLADMLLPSPTGGLPLYGKLRTYVSSSPYARP